MGSIGADPCRIGAWHAALALQLYGLVAVATAHTWSHAMHACKNSARVLQSLEAQAGPPCMPSPP